MYIIIAHAQYKFIDMPKLDMMMIHEAALFSSQNNIFVARTHNGGLDQYFRGAVTYLRFTKYRVTGQ